jgi:hypothetical protein
MAATSWTLMGHAADSPDSILRSSPATDHHAEILDVEDPSMGYNAETLLYQQP